MSTGGQVSTLICTPGAAACATPTPTDAQARSAHGSKTKPASHPHSSSFVASLGPSAACGCAESLSHAPETSSLEPASDQQPISGSRREKDTRRKDCSRALTREVLSSDRQEPLLRAQRAQDPDALPRLCMAPRATSRQTRLALNPRLSLRFRRDAQIANLALRGVVDQSVFRTVGPEDPLSVGGVYERRRAARRIHGPAFLR
jgi:hypothetical protein